ncbi:penicillin-binding protein 1A [Labrys sp. ZIDIC5]|uniref:penicillin-binding protein 1A n=1 Tax=Labrys sedimenti TaxID=3106036 RepID=UPI002ACA51E1|nr:penicillin-binding protein 1A [Labrys sp. ZIDIC5]MDZ5454818.1 penicillin-binding protein 1A [Labrys sp. ZIDIC5]
MIWIRFLGFVFSSLSLALLASAALMGGVIASINKDLPDYRQLQNYEPPIMTRVYAADGSILAEYARQRRIFVPIQLIPQTLIDAFLAAEDKGFYSNSGIDPLGVVRAIVNNLKQHGSDRRPMGASTITQQVVKNFFLNNEVSYRRKLEEAILALRISQTYSKDRILELYLNQIYLGSGNYGVAEAALNYFGRSLKNLSVAQMAYLASLPKAPSNYDPVRNREAAIARRNWVIGRMAHEGFITFDQAAQATQASLVASSRHVPLDHSNGVSYFAEDIRKQVSDRYGANELNEGGLVIRSSLDRRLQALSHKALIDGLVRWDQRQGYRGPVAHLDPSHDWHKALTGLDQPDDVAPWQLAVVLKVDHDTALIGLRHTPEGKRREASRLSTGTINSNGVRWVHSFGGHSVASVDDVLKAGDVVYVAPSAKDRSSFELRQIPEISGAIVVMDPVTGRILAMDGGFSFQYSNFNRATQAWRQPGSSFKPFIYAAALDDGYTPSTIVSDDPISIDPGGGQPLWSPANDGGKYYGPRPLRFGLEWSRNVMTVRVAQEIGMPLIARYARRFGIYDDLPPYIAMSLGSGATTLTRMVTAYAMLANGGKRVTPSLVDEIQDRNGSIIFRHDQRQCPDCNSPSWTGQDEPRLVNITEQVLPSTTAYQITSMLQGVVERGTASVLKSLGRPIAGKTGTTNDSKDVWFVGYSPHLVAGVYLGYDVPRPLGRIATGGRLAAPIFGEFMQAALAGTPAEPFQPPAGIKLITVNPRTGQRAGNEQGSLLEAFKIGTAPPDNGPINASLQQEGHGVSLGTGDLY